MKDTFYLSAVGGRNGTSETPVNLPQTPTPYGARASRPSGEAGESGAESGMGETPVPLFTTAAAKSKTSILPVYPSSVVAAATNDKQDACPTFAANSTSAARSMGGPPVPLFTAAPHASVSPSLPHVRGIKAPHSTAGASRRSIRFFPAGFSVCAAGRHFLLFALFLFAFVGAGTVECFAERFFEVLTPRVLEEKIPMKNTSGKTGKPHVETKATIEARIRIGADSPTGKFYVRAYFMDGLGRQLIYAPVAPIPQVFAKGYPATPIPLTLKKGNPERVRIPVPEHLMRQRVAWRAIIVFGDDREATAVMVGPSWLDISNEYPLWFDFPERDLCIKGSQKREADSTRLIELRCKTTLPDYPYFTLFARLPEGAKSGKDAKGVLCLSLLANQIADVRKSLLNHDAQGEVAEMIRYADSQNLLILCWASRSLWNASKNWDELPKAEAKRIDERFDAVAAAWEAGVRRMAGMQGFEPSNFLLWGFSASAQYAMRLAMRKPQFFNAVALQIPSSFDQPTKEASKVLWCLATGELESGYIRSQRFYKQCRLLNYRFVYKAVPGLGHRMHGDSMRLAKDFLDYALSLPRKPVPREERLRAEMDFPVFWGDWLNQNLETREDADFIPYGLRVPLPTERLARSWEMLRGGTGGWSSGANNAVPVEDAPAVVVVPPVAGAGDAAPAAAPAPKEEENTLFGKRVQNN